MPGAMEAGLGTLLFWGALSFALAVAFVAALPVNRWLIARGKGHAAVHRTGIHGGPNPRLVGTILAVAFVFGTAVLIAEALDTDDGGHSANRTRATPPKISLVREMAGATIVRELAAFGQDPTVPPDR